jgi:hypothetical protein
LRRSSKKDAVFEDGEFAGIVNNLVDDINVIEEEPEKDV